MKPVVEFETLPQLFLRVSALYAGQQRTALRYKDKSTREWTDISWEVLLERVRALAGYLHQQGVRRGDRVAILSENRPEWAIADLATQLLGGINVSLYTSLPASEVAYILQDSGSKIFVVSTAMQLKKAEEVFHDCPELQQVITMSEMRKERPDYVVAWDVAEQAGRAYWAANESELAPISDSIRPDDVAALIYTSGTTGFPKGVMLTHENFCSNATAALLRVPFSPDDLHLSFLPLSHSFEHLAGYIAIMGAGATIAYAESIDSVSKNLPEVKPTVMISVPRLFERMYNIINKSVQEGSAVKRLIFNWAVSTGRKAAHAEKPGPVLRWQQGVAHKLVFSKLHEKLGGQVRFAISGGAALPRAIGEFFQAAGIVIAEGYGLTETSPVLNINPLDAPRYGTVGHVIPGVTVGIMRLSDNSIVGKQLGDAYPSNLSTEEGEIIAKGPNIMKGYWKNEAATREAIDPAGWYHTGDVGRFVDGYLQITDRIKHMIVSKGGKNIYPGPIEEKFISYPFIEQLMVAGEGQPFLTALVVPNIDSLKHFAQENQIAYSTDEALLTNEAVLELFDGVFREYSKSASPHEKIRKFRLITEPFTVENGLMTPTLKLKRKTITERYAEEIAALYEGVV